ncbi:MAG TPA: NAD(P)H-binding protein, partial [Sphingomonadaceae bacterium]|nr:NAD(P)H-binding protein [Sphingomonadaceae bacterium]
MRIMLLGAGGFIGRHILAELLSVGHQVVAIVRGKAELAEAFPEADFLQLDLTGATDQIAWIERLKEIDCIVNSAGLLRGAQLDAIHVTMPRALYAAASQVGVKHVVLISAISARPDVATDYS